MVLRIPCGTKEVDDSNNKTDETEEYKTFIKEMKEKFSKFPPQLLVEQNRLIDSKDSRDYFKREVVFFYITNLIHQSLLKNLRHNLLRTVVNNMIFSTTTGASIHLQH